jgi:hypothetical protein
MKIKNNPILVMFALLVFGLACNLGDQTDEANKFVGEANDLIKKSNEQIPKANLLFTELLGSLSSVDNLEEHKKINKAKFDELIGLYDQIEKSSGEVVGKFEAASKLKLDEKYKQYLDAKLLELKKRSEADKMSAPFVKSFLETKDIDKVNKLIEDYNAKTEVNSKEADELMQKADQIAKDNPDKIK